MNTCSFKYKNNHFYNIMSCLLFIILILAIIIIFKYTNTILYKLLFVLLAFIICNLILAFLAKIVQVTNGRFTFDKHSFIYDTLNKEYTINYSEIEYISKDVYTDTDRLIRSENYVYTIKIKNAGAFTFKYVDDSLDDAMLLLSQNADIEISK